MVSAKLLRQCMRRSCWRLRGGVIRNLEGDVTRPVNFYDSEALGLMLCGGVVKMLEGDVTRPLNFYDSVCVCVCVCVSEAFALTIAWWSHKKCLRAVLSNH